MPLLPAVTGVQNWTCDPTTGNWTYQGWLVNGTDFKTGKHAGARQAGRALAHSAGSGICMGAPADVRCCRAQCCPAGYALTVPGPSGTHVPYFVATDEKNGTATGTLVNLREAGSVDLPR